MQNDLDGTVIGLLQDGDVLRIDAAGVLHIVMTEPEIGAKFAIATGTGSSIGDVQGIDWQGGELWVVTQSPSDFDGAVIAVGATPYVVMDEAAAALGGAEIDALSFLRPGEELARIYLETTTAAPGDVVRFDFLGEPNGIYLVLQCGGTGYHRFPMLNGFESLYFDPADPWLAAELGSLADNIAIMSPAGSLIFDSAHPPAAVFGRGFGGERGWSFQMIDLATREVSAPARLRM
jgi:hypothetical protein